MNVLIAVDSFKGTLSSIEVAEILNNHINKKLHNVDIISIGDGGEGTVDSIMYATNGIKKKLVVKDAFGELLESYYALTNNGKTAILEIALSSGIKNIHISKLNPLITTTYGLGETMKDALDQGVEKLVIGIGGSSTNDAGTGMLQALGVKFYDELDEEIPVMNGGTIGLVKSIDLMNLDPRLNDVIIEVACDVDNPLVGDKGCTYVYSKQKGANLDMMSILEKNMIRFSDIVKNKLNKDNRDIPGVGAAGGLGYGLMTFLDAKLLNGLEVVGHATKLEERIIAADIIITGEGSFDHQSLYGKAPVEVAKLAKKHDKIVFSIFGSSSVDELPELFDQMISIVPTITSLDEALGNPKESLEKLLNAKFRLG